VSRSTYAFALLAVAAALAIAGCGSSSSSGGAYGGKAGSESTSAGETTSGGESTGASSAGGAYAAPVESSGGGAAGGTAAVVSLASVPKLGLVLVNPKGFTLYDFHKDKGTKSVCYGKCAAVWPPLLSEGAPQVGNGASMSKLGTTKRSGGTTQVTYAGHPLYTYVADKKPGEANGNDFSSFGAQWYALKGSGEEAEG
jgi:predicted lipoprotein with Yx(FWY)xxD motif